MDIALTAASPYIMALRLSSMVAMLAKDCLEKDGIPLFIMPE